MYLDLARDMPATTDIMDGVIRCYRRRVAQRIFFLLSFVMYMVDEIFMTFIC